MKKIWLWLGLMSMSRIFPYVDLYVSEGTDDCRGVTFTNDEQYLEHVEKFEPETK